ncbi:MAG: hypothetical protein L3K06_00565 [Thermoplasmata archaeon]|nr:hypothetical protein [Thermoplasmata archaeon]MCI4353842.1 hypothetical protein [Thermoplasmata archaeon]
MDDKDVRIFCEMAFREGSYNSLTERHPSLSGIGRRLGLDEKTIRSRVVGMEKDGFIEYYQAAPHLALFGLDTVGVYRFEAVNLATKQRVLSEIRRAPGVVEAADFIGFTIDVSFAGTSPEATRGAAEALARQFELTWREIALHPLAAAPFEPDRLDWRIVQRLRYDARCPATSLARSLSITRRMAEYRLAKLLNSGALHVRAVINAHRQQGLIFYELEVTLDEAHRTKLTRRLQAQFGPKFWSAQEPTSGVLLANLFGFSLGDPEEAALQVLEYEGVRRCAVFIQKASVEPGRPSWIDRAIGERAVVAGALAPAAPRRRGRVRRT